MLIIFDEATGRLVSSFEARSDVEGAGYEGMIAQVLSGQRIALVDAISTPLIESHVASYVPDPVVSEVAVFASVHPRPAITHGWATTGAAPVTLGMGSLPVSTTVTATNEAGESVTTSDPTDPIILVDSETYMVTISPPWPYLPETLTIEVT